MSDLKELIRQSYDSRPSTETLSWASITSRRVHRGRGWKLSLGIIAVLLAGGVAVTTGGADGDRLPSTDFDVALAPNWDAPSNLIDRSTDLDGAGKLKGEFEPGESFRINGYVACVTTPASFGGVYFDYSQIPGFRTMTKQDFIGTCVDSYYKTKWYQAHVLSAANPTAGEIRGLGTGTVVLPDAFAVCVSGSETASITVIPGFSGITDMSHACQNLLLHPLDFNGEKRERFVVSDFREFQAWQDRNLKVEDSYPGFAPVGK